MATVILTNGTLITAQLADRLPSLYVHEIRVSLYGASALVHDAVTRTRGSFSTTLDGIRLLVQRGLRVSVTMPVLALNVREVPGVRELCVQLGVDFRYSVLLFPQNGGSHAPLGLLASDEQLHWLAEQERRSGSSSVGECSATRSAERRLCTAGAQQLGIGPDGSVYPCGALRLVAGNVHQKDLRAIWGSSPVLEALRRARPIFGTACGDCPVRSSCLWCPGLSLLLEGDMAVPNRQDCRRTRIFYGGVDGRRM
jgi:radical SAM protein with 4Fe4S-binding SPASM domain